MLFRIVTTLICFQLHLVWSNDLYSKFHQTDYKIETTRLELGWYNKDIYKKYEIVTFKYNRSLAVANLTFQPKIQLKNYETEVIIQVYKLLSNEYRIFPIRFQLNLCQLIRQNIAGTFSIISRCGNITDCDFQKDVLYHTCNMYPDQARFPPLIPNGEFKVELTHVSDKVTLAVLNAYGKVFRPIKIY